METEIQEIFSSIQGEGIYVGVRQIFLRFVGCNLSCTYCDTRETQIKGKDMFCIEIEPGTGKLEYYPNPVSVDELKRIIMPLKPEIHHSLSLTGGEPLLQVDFLYEFLPRWKRICPVFLETNGTLTQSLRKLLPLIDIISMDIKLPSATGLDLWKKHEEFLKIAKEKEIYVKTVLTVDTIKEELAQVVRIIERVDPSIPLVLQPVTPVGGVKEMTPDKVIKIQDYCSTVLKKVRVIPQTHKIINQL
ncbi:MAG: 7-carboxy-7-deazaguanine synthase QueE [Bacillota bacterium]